MINHFRAKKLFLIINLVFLLCKVSFSQTFDYADTTFTIGDKHIVQNIFFDFNKSVIRKESATTLDSMVAFIKKNPQLKIEIGVHTDERYPDQYSVHLSPKKAAAIRTELIHSGILPSNLMSKGYGKSEPIINNAKTEKEHAINRRVELKIIDFIKNPCKHMFVTTEMWKDRSNILPKLPCGLYGGETGDIYFKYRRKYEDNCVYINYDHYEVKVYQTDTSKEWGAAIDSLKNVIDLESFQILNDFYAKDKNHVFLFHYNSSGVYITMNHIIKPEEFEVFGDLRYAKDSLYIHYDLTPLKQADYNTFKINKSGTTPFDTYDKNRKYWFGEEVNE